MFEVRVGRNFAGTSVKRYEKLCRYPGCKRHRQAEYKGTPVTPERLTRHTEKSITAQKRRINGNTDRPAGNASRGFGKLIGAGIFT
ncbi:hypothetical protein D3C87_1775310 [compost metagenome]